MATITDLYYYWTKHASNDPSADVQRAAVTCYIPTGRCHDPDMLYISTINIKKGTNCNGMVLFFLGGAMMNVVPCNALKFD